MSTTTTESTTAADKQVTVDVPADRLPEFYAFFARFLADGPGRRGRGRRRGPGGHRPDGRGHGCHHEHHEHAHAGEAAPEPAPPAA